MNTQSIPAPCAAALVAALSAIVAEVCGPQKPYDGDSFLPAHLIDAAREALASAQDIGHLREGLQ